MCLWELSLLSLSEGVSQGMHFGNCYLWAKAPVFYFFIIVVGFLLLLLFFWFVLRTSDKVEKENTFPCCNRLRKTYTEDFNGFIQTSHVINASKGVLCGSIMWKSTRIRARGLRFYLLLPLNNCWPWTSQLASLPLVSHILQSVLDWMKNFIHSQNLELR